MRSAVEQILRFNRGFDRYSLSLKLARLELSAFSFFRGTYHIFCSDIQDGQFRKWPTTSASGPIVGDLHTENFGTFRAIDNKIVYDINDFDETTTSHYEYDLRRLATGVLLAAHDNQQRTGDGLNAAEACVRSYLQTLIRFEKAKSRQAFQETSSPKLVQRLRGTAQEKKRTAMLKDIVTESTPGAFRFVASEKHHAVPDKERLAIARAVPKFLRTVLAPQRSNPKKYKLLDVAFRIAGCGSLGRHRYALLFGKGLTDPETIETLRLIEWKDSLDSCLDVKSPHQSPGRAIHVFKAMCNFQLDPKRYLGYATVSGKPVQAREIGANDARFDHKTFLAIDSFLAATQAFGEITARVHLLGNLKKRGPRMLLTELANSEDRFVQRILAFAVAYTDRTLDDYDELKRRGAEIRRAWSV